MHRVWFNRISGGKGARLSCLRLSLGLGLLFGCAVPDHAAARSRDAEDSRKIPFQPRATGRQLRDQWVAPLRLKCQTQRDRSGCFAMQNGDRIEQVATRLIQQDPGCDDAVERYRETVTDCDSLICGSADQGAASTAYDANCLSSLLAWRHRDGTEQADPRPPAFGPAAGQGSGALDALILISRQDANKSSHHCAGLLIGPDRIVTARHCFTSTEDSKLPAARQFRITVASRPERSFELRAAEGFGAEKQPYVEDDFIVLPFKADETIRVPRLAWRSLDGPTEVVAASRFTGWDRARAASAPADETTQSLRWANAGMCFAMEAQRGCLRMFCQTVPGYSGAPVFGLNPDPDGSLVVYGLVSRRDRKGEECGLSLLRPGSTLVTIPKL